jgi:hypothetical protein
MNGQEQWLEANDRYLTGELAALRWRLERLAARAGSGPSSAAALEAQAAGPHAPAPAQIAPPVAPHAPQPPPEARSGLRFLRRRQGNTMLPAAPEPPQTQEADPFGAVPQVPDAAPGPVEAWDASHPPALTLLAQRFGLTDFERNTLLLCAAMEFDTRMAGLCARAQGDPGRPYPTFGLALLAFDHPAWDVLSPERPLRYWRLIEISQHAGQPLVSSAIRADERIVSYLKGLNYLDERLAPLVTEEPFADTLLSASQQEVANAIVAEMEAPRGADRLVTFQLAGPDQQSKLAVARAAAARLGLLLYVLRADAVPAQAEDQEYFVRLWHRESALLPISLLAEAPGGGESPAPQFGTITRICSRGLSVTFVDVQQPLPELAEISVPLDVSKPTPTEQREAWADALGADAGDRPSQLAGQFSFNLSTIRRLAAAAGEPADTSALWAACLRESRPALGSLAQLIDPKAAWDDLELPDTEKHLLRQIANQVSVRMAVYDDWGFRDKMNRGLGISALFAGETGTGKSMAAEVIANELGLLLYRIDLSAVVSKYIGETEKNLRKLFDTAENCGAILFFDEADALFGKRSEVKDSHDRYANIEINYLLQRMETYSGLAILATNAKAALDSAFLRRLRFVVDFRFPGTAERMAIWRKVFPAGAPVSGLDYERLADFNLAGGSIHNIAVNAAFLAAKAGTPITMPAVFEAMRAEFRKLERPVDETDFRWLEAVEGAG